MTFVRPKARICEISTVTVGGPALVLAGAADGSYNRFSSFMSIGDQTYVSVVEPGVAFWTGIGTYNNINQIALTTVEETKGTFGSGTKEVFAGSLASSGMLRDDISGAIVTGGASTAYTVSSFHGYATLAELDGAIIAFSPHANNGLAPTLSIDGLAGKPIRAAPGFALGSNVLLQGTPYTALYNNSDGAFYLHGMASNTYGVPLGASLDYWGPIAPGSAWAFPTGQALSRATYAGLFALIGSTYGGGDGSTTFNLPDRAGRISAMRESSATRLTIAKSGINGSLLGSANGLTEAVTMLRSDLPNEDLSVSGTATTSTSINFLSVNSTLDATYFAGSPGGGNVRYPDGGATPSHVGSSGTIAGSGKLNGNVTQTWMNNVQPTIVCNVIMRVL